MAETARKLSWSESDIRTSFRDAEDKQHQILVLAELNACDKKMIEDIVGYRPRQERNIREAYEERLTDLQIANRIGRSVVYVRRWRNLNGLQAHYKNKTLRNMDREYVMQLYQMGLYDTQIAEKAGSTPRLVFKWRKENNLPSNYQSGTLPECITCQRKARR